MKMTHRVFFEDARRMDTIPSGSIDLVVTSPPYPMIEMWDSLFYRQNDKVKDALTKGNGAEAFELMHKELDPVWDEIHRVLKAGGWVCINIGDATRTINANFRLYSNHSRILHYFLNLGFGALPDILWRKQTNAPNKFMGSGMLPAGAYVTLEHEYILIFRKGLKREFKCAEEKLNRQESAIFWEERNAWYSDIWTDIKGTGQGLPDGNLRFRSAAYPFELAYRLLCMFSVKGDTVLDPFLGTGTTIAAAIASGRNSVGLEIDPAFRDPILSMKSYIVDLSNDYIYNRINRHLHFIDHRIRTKGPLKYSNHNYGFPVITSQEQKILFNELEELEIDEGDAFKVLYSKQPQEIFCKDWSRVLGEDNKSLAPLKEFKPNSYKQKSEEAVYQMNLL